MRYLLLALALLFSSPAWSAPPPKDAQYNINVHVTASRSVLHSERSPRYQRLKVTIDGKNYELESVLGVSGLLGLGDYKARLEVDDHKNDYDSYEIYEFRFPNGKTREYQVVGQTE
ncbi:MAG TPA: hypothetical protein VE866_17900 [Candidatus Binatia bacterium]|jgi:hypothetical protein|nr:hypothetical protein [Candidatus Binatia bacterium]